MDSLSLSNSISKETRFENTEMSIAYFEDLKNRKNDAISNERIQNGDIILDTYEVTSNAISGGMGSVWRVHHNSWNTDLAMKRPQPRFFAEGGDAKKAQFVKECEYWINLGLHPNIVSCYYVREIGGVPTIFSEWMDGGSLSDRIKDGSLYEGTEEEIQERILDIAIQAARGLQYSHENGLIHQDFKPGNLLLTKEWDAKVADFGLAKAKSNLDDKSDTAKTTGYTLAYCPQEQVDHEEPQKWMDVYSWALTVLEMYAGKRLWQTGAEVKEHFDEYLAQCKFKLPNKMPDLLKDCLNIRTNEKYVFDVAEKTLLLIYKAMNGEEYPVEKPSSAGDTADSLNNRALSFLDLGKSEEAVQLWARALKVKPNHFYTTYNLLTKKWYDGQIDDLTVLVRLREIERFMKLEDSAEGLRHVAKCRGADEAVKSEPYPDVDNAASDDAVFEYINREHHTKLVGVNPRKTERGTAFGNLKLYDTVSGRCIRTICPGLSDDKTISGGAESDRFGEARMTADGCYCYPDAAHTTLYYRRPDMESRPPVWILSRIQPYSELAEKKRKLNEHIAAAEQYLKDMDISEANEQINEAYHYVGSTENRTLNALNEQVGHFGRINGIRNYSIAEVSKDDLEYGESNTFSTLNNDCYYELDLHRGALKMAEFSSREYYLQSIKGEKTEKNFVVAVKGKDEETVFRVRGTMMRVSPDENLAVTVEYVEEDGAPIRRLLHVYSIMEKSELKTIPIPDNTFDLSIEPKPLYEMMIRDMCFRYDGKAVFLAKASGAITMIDLESGEELVLNGDHITSDSRELGLSNQRIVRIGSDKNGVQFKTADRYWVTWKITYQFEFKGWTKWDSGADRVLEKFSKEQFIFTEKLLDDFLAELRKEGYANISPKAARTALQAACARMDRVDIVRSYKPFFIRLGITVALFVAFALGLWRYKVLDNQINKLQSIWNNGESVTATVEAPESDWIFNSVTLYYLVDGKQYEQHCTVPYGGYRASYYFEGFQDGKGKVELHYLPDDPDHYSINILYAMLSEWEQFWKILFVVAFVSAAGMLISTVFHLCREKRYRYVSKKRTKNDDAYALKTQGKHKL